MNYFLLGLPGSGKSHWGELWAQAAGLTFIDLDQYIEDKEQLTVAEIFNRKGEKHFRDLETFYLKELIGLKKETIIACGGGTPCFNENMELINKNGISVFINTDTQVITNHLLQQKEIEKRPLFTPLKSDLEVKTYLDNLLNHRIKYYKKARHEIIPGLNNNTLNILLKINKS